MGREREPTDAERKIPLIDRPPETLTSGEKKLLEERLSTEAKAGRGFTRTDTTKQILQENPELQRKVSESQLKAATKGRDIITEVGTTITERGTRDVTKIYDAQTRQLIATKTDTSLNIFLDQQGRMVSPTREQRTGTARPPLQPTKAEKVITAKAEPTVLNLGKGARTSPQSYGVETATRTVITPTKRNMLSQVTEMSPTKTRLFAQDRGLLKYGDGQQRVPSADIKGLMQNIDFESGVLSPKINLDFDRVVDTSRSSFSLPDFDFKAETDVLRTKRQQVSPSKFGLLPFVGGYFTRQQENFLKDARFNPEAYSSPFVDSYETILTGGGQGTSIRFTDTFLTQALEEQSKLYDDVRVAREIQSGRAAGELVVAFPLVGAKVAGIAKTAVFRTQTGRMVLGAAGSAVLASNINKLETQFREAETPREYAIASEDTLMTYSRFAAFFTGAKLQKVAELKIDAPTFKYVPTKSFIDVTSKGTILSGQTQLKPPDIDPITLQPKAYDPFTKFEKPQLGTQRLDLTIQKTFPKQPRLMVTAEKGRLVYDIQTTTPEAIFQKFPITPLKDTKLTDFSDMTVKQQYGTPSKTIEQVEFVVVKGKGAKPRLFFFDKRGEIMRGQLVERQTPEVSQDLYEKSTLRSYQDPIIREVTKLRPPDFVYAGFGLQTPLFSSLDLQPEVTQQIPDTRIKTSTIQEIERVQKIFTAQRSDIILDTMQRSTIDFAPAKPVTITDTLVAQRRKLATDTQTIQIQQPQEKVTTITQPPIQTQIPKIQPLSAPPPPQPPPFIIPLPSFLGVGFGRGRGILQPTFTKGFNVFVRRQGTFRQINLRPLDRREALSLGVGRVSTTAAATFKLKPAREPAMKTSGFAGFDKIKLSQQFTKRKEKDKEIFIEKPKFRISTWGELQEITFKPRGLKNVKF